MSASDVKPLITGAASAAGAEYCIPLGDVRCAKAAADPSLPQGPALWLQLSSHPQVSLTVKQIQKSHMNTRFHI